MLLEQRRESAALPPAIDVAGEDLASGSTTWTALPGLGETTLSAGAPQWGTDYMHARYFSPTTARFLSTDPVLGTPGSPQSWNRYAYVAGNPLKYVDPSGAVMMTTAAATIAEIAGEAADRVCVANGVVDVSRLTASDLETNEGAKLLSDLALSPNTYGYSESRTAATKGGAIFNPGIKNLDNGADWRFRAGKLDTDLPPAGTDSMVSINPGLRLVDYQTQKLDVSMAAVAFHELAEAYGKVDLGLQYNYPGGRPGAHAYAIQREQLLLQQRPGFTAFPAGGLLHLKP